MIHPTPPGTRDILPEEMRELRALEAALRAAFEEHGFGEVATPTIEYAETLQRGDERFANAAYRFFDERGDLLAMRSDMTIPIARLVSGRLMGTEPPFRFFYVGSAYRAVRPQRGQMREFMQAGVELIGADAPEGTAEVVEVLVSALDAAGLSRAVIGLGDADLYRQLLADVGVDGEVRGEVLDRLATHDLVGIEEMVGAVSGIAKRNRETLRRLPTLRGGSEILEVARELGGG